MAKRAGLPWDCVLSAELFRALQARSGGLPRRCADLLGVAPAELMLVAAHPSDLRAARDVGAEDGLRRRGRWSTAPTGAAQVSMTANSTSRQRIFPTLPTSWVPERAA